MGLSSFIFWWAPSNASFLQDCVSAVQGHPRSLIFGTNRKRTCDFLLVRHSNLGSILHRFRDIVGLHHTPIPP